MAQTILSAVGIRLADFAPPHMRDEMLAYVMHKYRELRETVDRFVNHKNRRDQKITVSALRKLIQ